MGSIEAIITVVIVALTCKATCRWSAWKSNVDSNPVPMAVFNNDSGQGQAAVPITGIPTSVMTNPVEGFEDENGRNYKRIE